MKTAAKYNKVVEFWIKNDDSYELDFADFGYVKTKDETRTLQENQLILEGFYEIYLRFRADIAITKSHQLKLKDMNLTIHSILNVDELDKEIKLIASESDNIVDLENPYENYK